MAIILELFGQASLNSSSNKLIRSRIVNAMSIQLGRPRRLPPMVRTEVRQFDVTHVRMIKVASVPG